MRFISVNDWPASYACTYEAYNYAYVPEPPPHEQDYLELFWIESGEGCHLYKGEQRPMPTGYLALIRKDDWHGFSAWEEGGRMRLINFAFHPSLWEQLRDNFFPGESCFFDRKPIEEREFFLGADDRERFRHLGFDLAAGRWDTTNAAAFLLGVLCLLANRLSGGQAHSPTPEWLTRAVRTIESWPNFVGGVPEFVRLAGRSHEHVCRSCQQYLNTTPRDLINRARLKWASMQLETSDKQIIEIAEECGFENLGYFYKQFRAAHRTTPRQYRIKYGLPQYP
jgi:AraC family cel operon transcriptional repressor